jgi:hypothetical protein
MLSEQSYHLALYVYLGSAGMIILCLGWWLGRSWGAGWALLTALLAAALLLTPAYPNADADTMAPALVVAAFLLFTAGPEAAEHALRPLAFACLAGLVLAVLLRFTLFRRRRDGSPSPTAKTPG